MRCPLTQPWICLVCTPMSGASSSVVAPVRFFRLSRALRTLFPLTFFMSFSLSTLHWCVQSVRVFTVTARCLGVDGAGALLSLVVVAVVLQRTSDVVLRNRATVAVPSTGARHRRRVFSSDTRRAGGVARVCCCVVCLVGNYGAHAWAAAPGAAASLLRSALLISCRHPSPLHTLWKCVECSCCIGKYRPPS